LVFFSPITPPPPSSTLFPYTTLFRSELVDRRGRERLLVFGDPLAADPLEVADRGGESDRAFDVRRPRFELVRDLVVGGMIVPHADRKSTRLNSSHLVISYAVFCLKKK